MWRLTQAYLLAAHAASQGIVIWRKAISANLLHTWPQTRPWLAIMLWLTVAVIDRDRDTSESMDIFLWILNGLNVEWFKLKWSEFKWFKTDRFNLEWFKLEWFELKWLKLNRFRLKWFRLKWFNLEWFKCKWFRLRLMIYKQQHCQNNFRSFLMDQCLIAPHASSEHFLVTSWMICSRLQKRVKNGCHDFEDMLCIDKWNIMKHFKSGFTSCSLRSCLLAWIMECFCPKMSNCFVVVVVFLCLLQLSH